MPPDAQPAAAPQSFRVVEMSKVPSPHAQRLGKWDRMVWVEIAEGRRIVLLVPDESFTEGALREAVRKELQERGLWLNKSFQL